jgi:PTH1 family peptidyl-tRNA hydrolase
LASFYKIPPENILVVFDDLDIPPGTLRIRSKGGTGGHRGLTDIVQRLGTKDIPRIRFGIGRPPGQMDPAAYVLRRFDADEHPVIREAIDRALQAIETWLIDGIDTAMNHYNGSADEVANRFAEPAPPESESHSPSNAQDH